jgi:type II secretory pathway component PulL
VKTQNFLGIYLSNYEATVVCLGPVSDGKNLVDCFSVSVEKAEMPDYHQLATLIAQKCTDRQLGFSEVAVALDCALFMQHNLHTDFTDAKQIAATIRFDTEEAIATDITNLVLAFKINSSSDAGSELTVFTAKRKILSEILLALQANNLDPTTIEPDIYSLARFISQKTFIAEDAQPFFALFSQRNAFFLLPATPGPQNQLPLPPIGMRTLLIDSTQNKNDLLEVQLPITSAVITSDQPTNSLKVFDSTDSMDIERITKKLCLPTKHVDVSPAFGSEPMLIADCSDTTDLAVAWGAAIAHLEKIPSINFRNDFSPFQGKKIRLQKALRLLSIALTVLFIALGLYFQIQLIQQNKYRSRLRKKFAKQYAAVMFGKKPPKKYPEKKLSGELRRIKDVKSGQLSVTGKEAVSAKLTLLLEAFNSCAKQTNLNINSVAITTRTISITGNTSNRKNTLKLFDAIRKAGLDISQQRLDSKAGRDNFRITVATKT